MKELSKNDLNSISGGSVSKYLIFKEEQENE